MKKISLAFLALIAFVSVTTAQKYKRIYYKDLTIETSDIKIVVNDAVSTPAGLKFRLHIFNKTNKYIVYKPSESVFKIGGKDYNPDEKWMIIRPNDDEAQTIDLKGADYMTTDKFDVVMSGLYTFSTDVKSVNTPDFKLPPAQNDIKAGGFNISLLKNKKTTAHTDATFTANYVGDKIGVFEPNKVAMKMADGKEYANFHSDKKPIVFAKGQTNDFAVAWKDVPSSSGDVQKDEMTIIWRDAFKEITPDKMLPQTLTIMFDQETTQAKNK